MWMIDNQTPFAAERSWVRDKNGAEVWLVAVRATFMINPDGSKTLAEKQDEVCLVPKYRGEPDKSSLLYESDLVHTKPTTDIILHGQAYAPPEEWVTQVDVTLKVAHIQKTLRVFGNRYWEKGLMGLKVSEPEFFKTMPITYERAFGGIDQLADNPKQHDWEPRNPVGTGFAVKAEHLVNRPVANIEYPQQRISSWKQRPSPAGFGPLAGHWSPRINYAGTYDEKWEKEKQPLLPADFDERFYLCAPTDQQPPHYLKGGELVELYNLTSSNFLSFKLPQVILEFNTCFRGEVIPHQADLHSVILEPDFPRIIMVWHTHLPCHPKVLKLDHTTITLKEWII